MDGDTALIAVDAAGMTDRDPFTAIVSIADSSGAQLEILTASLSAEAGGSAGHTFRWRPPGGGVFRMTAYLWRGTNRPVPLCDAASESVNVVDRIFPDSDSGQES